MRIMKISDIQRGMSGIAIEVKVIDISEPRDVQTRYWETTRKT